MPLEGEAWVMMQDTRFVRASTHAQLGPQAGSAPAIVARPAAQIKGKVVLANGKPAKDMLVEVFISNMGTDFAVTKADGTYLLESLAAGPATLATEDRSGKLVSSETPKVNTVEGKTVTAPDIVLIQPATIEGTIVDEVTGKPRPNISVYIAGPQGSWTTAGGARAMSDKNGRFTARVAPGKNTIQLFNKDGYGRPEPQMTVEVKKGEKKAVTIRLAKGEVFSGRLIDTNGKPLANQRIVVLVMADEAHNNQMGGRATTDKTGSFRVTDLVAGKAKLSINDSHEAQEWEMVKPKEIVLPTKGTVTITMRKRSLLSVTTRVVTPDGKPIPGATVHIQLVWPEENGFWKTDNKRLGSNPKGEITISGIQPDNKIELKSAEKRGYKYVSGGEFTHTEGRMAISEIVLAPLTGSLQGRVVDKSGSPVAGAYVAAPEGWPKARTRTNESGEFTLGSLPDGEVMLMAASGHDAGNAKAAAGENVTITLSPSRRLSGPDLELGRAILKEAWVDSEGKDYQVRKYVPLELVPYDLDAAMEMATGKDGKMSDQVLAGVIATLAIVDPDRAVDWGLTRLDNITARNHHVWAISALALAVADKNPAMAADLYQRSKALLDPVKDTSRSVTSYGIVAALAARLNNGEAESILKDALSLKHTEKGYEGKTIGGDSHSVSYLLEIAARGGPEPALSMAEAGDAYAKSSVLIALARSAAKKGDVAAAMDMLNRIEGLGDASMVEYSYGRAASSVIKAMGKTDPAGALAIARKVTDRRYVSGALALAASFQPRETALQLLREASSSAVADYNDGPMQMAEAAAQAYKLDPKVGEELFAAALREIDRGGEQQARNIPGVAFYYSQADPAEARLILEARFAEFGKKLSEEDSGWHVKSAGLAMAPLDIDRALEIIRSIPQEKYARYDGLRKLAQYVLASEELRLKVNYDYWSGSNTWQPEMPVWLGAPLWAKCSISLVR